MAYDTFVGLPLDQSIASAAWDNGAVSWGSVTYLVGNGSNAVKSANNGSQGQCLGNYNSLSGQIGQAVFFKMSPGRVTTSMAIAIYIDGPGPHSIYAPNSVRANVGVYNTLQIRDMAAGVQNEVAFTLTDNTEYCLELIKTTDASGKQYRATVYAASNGVRGAQLATQTITLGTALSGSNRQVQVASQNGTLVTINRVESVDAAATDTTPPNLSAPNVTATSSTTATGTVATDEGGGTLYYYVSTSSTETMATIKSSGGSQAVGNTGTQTVSLTGLTPGSTNYLHFVHTDAAGNNSAVTSTASFTLPTADTVAPTFAGGSVITPGAITSSSLAFSYPAATDNVAVTGYQTSKDSGANWQDNGTGLSGQFIGLTASTTYPIWVRAYDNGSPRNYSTPLQLNMTTSAATTGSFTTDALTTSGTLRANQAVSWTWFSGGVVGTSSGAPTHGSSTLSGGATLTITGLPNGAGYLMMKFNDGGIAYQAGTVA